MSGDRTSAARESPVEDPVEVAARRAMANAYAPYSGFRVGAAVLTTDGAIMAGCNVENAAFPAGLCAERGAIVAAIAAGHRTFERLVLVTDAPDPTPPCGVCRQVLVEFAPDLPVRSIGAAGRAADWTLADLLPRPFRPASLGVA